ncbi:hypothetical protein V7O62_08040 [Methanolobus sp. ZRKC2]|uniref:DUF7287 family protein n=1 Tax=Methanolobus sp. ZRKC2 TaxID=3125783 RepID=UPI00324B68BB
MMDEDGQISVDFLLGISLFLIALTFTVQFIPGLFIPGSAGESSLDYTAYRTSAVLAEDTGWWGNSMTSGTEWEEHPDDILRIGLAVDDDNTSKLTNTPNLLSKNKIERMMLVNKSILVEKLGLYNNVNDAIFSYGYNISITRDNVPFVLNNTAIQRGETIPVDREIAKITRIVLVETGNAAYFDAAELTTKHAPPSEMAILNVTGPYSDNITIQIGSFNVTGTNPTFENITLNGTTLVASSNYTAYKKAGWKYSTFNGKLDSTDLLCLEFNYSLFNTNQTHQLEFIFNNVSFTQSAPPTLEYRDRNEILYEPAYLTVEVWQ